MEERDTRAAVMNGLLNRCPNCGKGRILKGYLTLVPSCDACGEPLGRYPAADGPAFFAMTIMLLLLIPMIGFTWVLFRPSPAVFLAVLLGSTTLITLILLRVVKSAFIGYLWAKNERDRGA